MEFAREERVLVAAEVTRRSLPLDADTITTSCKAFMDGKEVADHPTILKRIKG
jgi:hypothetical protein